MSEPFAPEREYAGWWSRVGAYLLDSLLITVVVLVVGGVLYAVIGDAGIVIGYVLILLLPFVYFTYFHGRPGGGQTPGKSALGIRVRREDGSDLGYGRALARYAFTVLLSIFAIPLLIDYLWPLWDAKNQSLHDKIAKSVVQTA